MYQMFIIDIVPYRSQVFRKEHQVQRGTTSPMRRRTVDTLCLPGYISEYW